MLPLKSHKTKIIPKFNELKLFVCENIIIKTEILSHFKSSFTANHIINFVDIEF